MKRKREGRRARKGGGKCEETEEDAKEETDEQSGELEG